MKKADAITTGITLIVIESACVPDHFLLFPLCGVGF